MPNTLLTIGDMSREALMILENNLKFTSRVYRGYDDRFAKTGAKIGATANIRKPVRYTVGQGAAITPQDSTETSVPVTINRQWHVPIQFSSVELTLSIDDFSKRYLQPAMAALANQIDFEGLTMAYQSTASTVGTPGTIPSTVATILAAGVRLDHMGAPRDGKRSLVVNPATNASYVDSLKGLFNNQASIGEQYKNGMVAKSTLGFDWYMDQNINLHTVGPLGGTPLVNGAGQTGAAGTLVTDGWTASAALRLRQGDVFTIAGVNAVNPQSRQSTGELMQFVVTANASSDGSGNMSIPFRCQDGGPMVATGAYQNVTALPADNAAITVLGAANTVTPQNIAFHENAFTLATVDLESNLDGATSDRVSSRNMSLRVTRQYNIMTDMNICRIDVLGGWAPLYPELACRIAS